MLVLVLVRVLVQAARLATAGLFETCRLCAAEAGVLKLLLPSPAVTCCWCRGRSCWAEGGGSSASSSLGADMGAFGWWVVASGGVTRVVIARDEMATPSQVREGTFPVRFAPFATTFHTPTRTCFVRLRHISILPMTNLRLDEMLNSTWLELTNAPTPPFSPRLASKCRCPPHDAINLGYNHAVTKKTE